MARREMGTAKRGMGTAKRGAAPATAPAESTRRRKILKNRTKVLPAQK